MNKMAFNILPIPKVKWIDTTLFWKKEFQYKKKQIVLSGIESREMVCHLKIDILNEAWKGLHRTESLSFYQHLTLYNFLELKYVGICSLAYCKRVYNSSHIQSHLLKRCLCEINSMDCWITHHTRQFCNAHN